MNIDAAALSRLEIIDETGRRFTRWDCQLLISIQDDGRTMKIFVEQRVPDFSPTPKKEEPE